MAILARKIVKKRGKRSSMKKTTDQGTSRK